MKNTICKEEGECFAKQGLIEHARCKILNDTEGYGGGTCPFQKPDRDVTKGIRYPFSPR